MKEREERKGMLITDFFDSDRPEHVAAWEYWRRSGKWPRGFLPRGRKVEYPRNWDGIIAHVVAARWPRMRGAEVGSQRTEDG